VQTLVVADGAHVDGSQCPNCARLDRGRVAACPACGQPMQPVHDLIHRAMARTLDQAGSVEIVRGRAGRRLHELGEGVGAILRYRSPAVSVAGGA
jgi:peptide subunit release factor 1 (eRF1)